MSNRQHLRILKSTTIIGGSSVVNILFKIIQAKAAAILIGPSGVGLMGLFITTIGLASTIAGMGLGTSGVRQIADAAGSHDETNIAQTAITVKRLAFALGMLGSLIFFALRNPISQITFGGQQYAGALGLLSVVILLRTVAGAQNTLVRGVRRIGDLARSTVLGVALGTLLGLPVLYIWREAGVAPYLVLVAAATLLASWWYARKIRLASVALGWRAFIQGARGLLALGVVFMVTGLTTLATTYLVKVVVTRQLGLDATGLLQASNMLAVTYVGFILGAMGADFFPHLSAVTHDNQQSNDLINAQVEVGLLFAVPGILAVLALGPWLLQILYSSEFLPAFSILRWEAMGVFLRVVSWPIGFLLLARGKGRLYFGAEMGTNLFYLICVWFGLRGFGLTGLGMAFFAMYVFYMSLMTLLARNLSGFRWSGRNVRLMGMLSPAILVAFLVSFGRSPLLVALVEVALLLGVGTFCLKALYKLVGPETVRSYLQKIRIRLGRSEMNHV